MPTEPYVPNPPPQGGDIEETQRYLREEFQRVALAIRSTTVQAAFGGVAITTPANFIANIAPQPLAPWQNFYPPRPSRVSTNPESGQVPEGSVLIPLEDGAYQFDAQVNIDGDAGQGYFLTLYKNDQPLEVFGHWDLSNQSNSLWLKFGVLLEGKAGDIYSVWFAAEADGATFDVKTANFQCFRVSELLNVIT